MSGHKRKLETVSYEKENLTKLLDDTVKILIDDNIKIENKNELARDMDNVENVLQELNKRMQKEGLVAKNEIRGNNELILKSKLDEIEIENKRLENENLILKENVKIKETQLVKYKAEFKQLQSKITEFVNKAIAKEMEFELMEKEVTEKNSIINETERKYKELSKTNSRFSLEIQSQSGVIKDQEHEIEDIKNKYKLRQEEIKELVYVILKNKQSLMKVTKDSLLKISRLNHEIKTMKTTNTTTIVLLQKRYEKLIKEMKKRKRTSKKENISLSNSKPEVTKEAIDDDISIISEFDNKHNQYTSKSDDNTSKSSSRQILENVYKNFTKNSLGYSLVSIDEQGTSHRSDFLWNEDLSTKKSPSSKDKHIANETVANILNEILQKVQDRAVSACDTTNRSLNTILDTRRSFGFNHVEILQESSLKKMERDMSEDDHVLKSEVSEEVPKIEDLEAITAKDEQDVTYEIPSIQVSNTIKVGKVNDKLDPIIKFDLKVTNTVRKVLLFFNEQKGKIASKAEFIFLLKKFSSMFREDIKDSYRTIKGSLEGIYLTPDNRTFIKEQMEMYFEKIY